MRWAVDTFVLAKPYLLASLTGLALLPLIGVDPVGTGLTTFLPEAFPSPQSTVSLSVGVGVLWVALFAFISATNLLRGFQRYCVVGREVTLTYQDPKGDSVLITEESVIEAYRPGLKNFRHTMAVPDGRIPREKIRCGTSQRQSGAVEALGDESTEQNWEVFHTLSEPIKVGLIRRKPHHTRVNITYVSQGAFSRDKEWYNFEEYDYRIKFLRVVIKTAGREIKAAYCYVINTEFSEAIRHEATTIAADQAVFDLHNIQQRRISFIWEL